MPLRYALLGGLLGLGLLSETLWPLRRAHYAKPKRVLINLSLAALSALILRATVYPLVLIAATTAGERHWGLLGSLPLSGPAKTLLGIVALDYTLYFWHRLNHGPALFWRFHNVHHADLDMDVSTASRFHFGELFLSAGFRVGQIVVFGIDPFTLIAFEILITSAAQFHHANVRLPTRLERALNWLFVTPRMHGIHHSLVREETDSNYGTIFTIWDRLHRTCRLDVPQEEIVIGVPGYRDEAGLTLWNCLRLPFLRLRPWRLADGTVPNRASSLEVSR